jgi:HAD superfamily phosphatase (TIGR01681 family)
MAIYVVGDQNTNNIGRYLKAEASEFNSWFTETMMPTSKLWSKDIKHVVYLFSPRVLYDSQFLSNLYVVLSNVGARSSDKQFYFCTVFPDPTMSMWMLEGKSLHEQAFVINDKIRWMTSAHPQMHVIDMEGLVLQHGLEKLHDRRFEIVGRTYFSSLLGTKLVAEHIERYISAATKPRKKVLAVDLDDTLWGGVLGEEDMNIQLGGTGTGYAFLLFQREIKRLKDSGVLLAILSKNDEVHALEMIRTHPDMVLRESDFVAHRINWEPKAENLMSIADELGLGFDSFVFMDDNTYECELMKTILPEVDVINLPLEALTQLPSQMKTARRPKCTWPRRHARNCGRPRHSKTTSKALRCMLVLRQSPRTIRR